MKKKLHRNLYSPDRSPLFKLRSIHKLADYIGCREKQLRRGSRLFEKFYEGEVRANNKKPRPTQVPFGHLRAVHDRIEDLFQRIFPPTYLHSAYPGKSYVSHAEVHRESREIYCIDIKNFFPETGFQRIEEMFLNRFQCSRDVAVVLAKLLTHKGWLATGSPASAIIAFYAHKEMFDEIHACTSTRNLEMSVLMDDICISGPFVPRTVKSNVRGIIQKHGRVGHKEKHFPYGKTAEVTGVVIKNNRLYGPSRRHLKTIEAHKNFRNSEGHEEQLKAYQRLASRLGELGQIEKRSKDRLDRYRSVYQHRKRLHNPEK